MKRLVLAIALLAAGCGSQQAQQQQQQQPQATKVAAKPVAAAPPNCNPTANVPASVGNKTVVAVVRPGTIATAYRYVGTDAFHRFGRHNVNGVPTVFAVSALRDTRACKPAWYRVALPVRPNGTSGWVKASDVNVLAVDTKLVIRLRAATIELVRAGNVVFHAKVAPGAPDTPTPTGTFYVTQRLIPADPNGPWGPAALGTSAYSPVLKDWPQGGPIGIHGTDEPWVIGHPASHGCIRLLNSEMVKLFKLTPTGTPIVISA
ncbi:MAG TPA: L,D-transpeptidase [Gaiellaceae bacterium]